MSNPLQSRKGKSLLSKLLFWRRDAEVHPVIGQPDVNPERTREFYNSGRELAIQSLARGKNADRYIQRARDLYWPESGMGSTATRDLYNLMTGDRREANLRLAERELNAERAYANEAGIQDFLRRGSMTSERDMDPYMIDKEIRGFLYGERPQRRPNAPPNP